MGGRCAPEEDPIQETGATGRVIAPTCSVDLFLLGNFLNCKMTERLPRASGAHLQERQLPSRDGGSRGPSRRCPWSLLPRDQGLSPASPRACEQTTPSSTQKPGAQPIHHSQVLQPALF